MKSLKFMGDSQQALASFPELAKREAGFELWQVQLGLMPSDFKPMPTVGAGAYEIRVKVQGHKTAQPGIELAAKRYKLIGVQHGKKQERP